MSTLPDKWAVEITNQKDADRLQALFPEGKSSSKKKFSVLYRFSSIVNKTNEICFVRDVTNGFLYSDKTSEFRSNGTYTIYTITELETLLNER